MLHQLSCSNQTGAAQVQQRGQSVEDCLAETHVPFLGVRPSSSLLPVSATFTCKQSRSKQGGLQLHLLESPLPLRFWAFPAKQLQVTHFHMKPIISSCKLSPEHPATGEEALSGDAESSGSLLGGDQQQSRHGPQCIPQQAREPGMGSLSSFC